jgi:hypothetical protein
MEQLLIKKANHTIRFFYSIALFNSALIIYWTTRTVDWCKWCFVTVKI